MTKGSELSLEEKIERLDMVVQTLIAWSNDLGIHNQEFLLKIANAKDWKTQYNKIGKLNTTKSERSNETKYLHPFIL